MPLPPVRYATLAIVVFLAIAGFDIVTGLEHWPFGSYPMYSLSYPEELSWLRLYAVTDRGEIALRGERDFAPFDEARLVMAPLKKSLSALTTRKEVAPGRCLCRTASAARMRSSKNFSSTSTRSGESTRPTILDLELKKPMPINRWRWSLT